MNIHHFHYYFDDLESKQLDPVGVHIEAYPREGQENPFIGAAFHFAVRCYGRIWTTFVASPGQCTPTAFLRSSGTDYLVDRLIDLHGKTKAGEKQDRKYLKKIIDAIKGDLLDDQERQQRYCQNLLEQPGVVEVDYKHPDDVPRFDKIVLVQYMNSPTIWGPAPANNFDWHQAEGKPNIDKFWILPGERNDV